MADNTQLPATGTGTADIKVATDQIPGSLEHYQYFKMADGTANSTWNQIVTGQHEGLVAERTLLFGDTFNAALDTGHWTSTLVGSGANSISGGLLIQATGATANSTVLLRSLPVHRLLPGSYNLFSTVAAFDAGAANNLRNWGVYSATDGFFFQLNSGGLSIASRKASSDTLVAHGSFSEADFTMDTNYHRYEILIGSMSAWFYVDGVIRHKLSANPAAPWTNTTDFPIALENLNSGGSTSNLSAFYAAAGYWRLGHPLQRPRWKHFGTNQTNTTIKTGAGTLRRVIINASTGGTATFADLVGSTASAIITVLNVTTGAGSGNARNAEFDLDFYTGLSVTSTAGFDFTVVYD